MFRNKLKYIAVIIFAGFLAVLYNDYYMGILFLAVAACPIVLLAVLIYIYLRLEVEFTSVVHVVNKGETMPVSVQIHNPTIFPVAFINVTVCFSNTFLEQDKENRQVFYVSVDSRSTTNASFSLKSDYAGSVIISLSGVRVFDYLKIFSLKKKVHGEIKVAVLPRYYELTGDLLKNGSKIQIESDYYSKTKSGDDPSEVFAIREYREGDRLQRIHWKLSLKQDQLMIKDFSEPLNCSVVIMADLGITGRDRLPDITDSLLECALSLSYSFMLKGQIHYLAWYDKKQGSSRRIRIVTENVFFDAVDGLLGSGPYFDIVDLAAVYYSQYPNDQYTELFYITNIITEERLDSLIWVKAADRRIIYINSEEHSPVKSHSGKRQSMLNSEKLSVKIAETGISLFSVNVSDIKAGLESLNFN